MFVHDRPSQEEECFHVTRPFQTGSPAHRLLSEKNGISMVELRKAKRMQEIWKDNKIVFGKNLFELTVSLNIPKNSKQQHKWVY